MRKILLVAGILVFALSSCNLPSTQEPALPLEQQAATVVSLTLTAIAKGENFPPAIPTTAEATNAQLASPSGPAATLQPNATPTSSTGTPSATILTVDLNTNCREGPGQNYAVVITLVAGTTYQMIARSADNKYWVIIQPGSSVSCWVLAEFSNAFGNITLLPVTTPAAATSSAGALQAPTGLAWAHSCSFNGASYDITVTLRWTDRSNNESGFRVYRDGVVMANLPANTTTYKEVFAGGSAQVYSYRVSAWNANGEASGSPISFSCQQ